MPRKLQFVYSLLIFFFNLRNSAIIAASSLISTGGRFSGEGSLLSVKLSFMLLSISMQLPFHCFVIARISELLISYRLQYLANEYSKIISAFTLFQNCHSVAVLFVIFPNFHCATVSLFSVMCCGILSPF
ncbi:MAG: hypothetical protein BWX72_02126 [Firmicutes bacterium ADurb.Bin080]|nr:MAG: hypothetical protein BWX72_02126 [Firmicutes bacterium ADurb.Bin080]